MIDQGYRVYYIDVSTKENPNQKPFVIFAGTHVFPPPDWAKGQDEEKLYTEFRPRR
jgi:hypothetical protein